MPAESHADGDVGPGTGTGLGPGDLVAERFSICRFLGKGRFAEVFKADDTRFHRYVALKVPLRGLERGTELWRLVKEVKAAQQVTHPNVVRAWELGTFDDGAGGRGSFIASELVEGDTLETVLERSVGGLSRTEKLNIAHDLCAGVEAIHRQQLLHRDLKPGNVMLTADGRAMITDFGLATLAGAATDPLSGTPGYRAPELLAGGQPSVGSDLYALGVVLYELFAGRHPFDGEDREMGADERPPFPQGVETVGVAEAIWRCLEAHPEKRPSSARQLAEQLPPRPRPGEERLWTVPVETLLIDPAPRFSRLFCHRLLAAALVALAVVLALGSAYRPLAAVTAGDPPVVLEYRARDLLVSLGFEGAGSEERGRGDHLGGYRLAGGHGKAADPLPRVAYWSRWSPSPLVAGRSGTAFLRFDDPPLATPGEVRVELDPRGRLIRLDAVPPADAAAGRRAEVDWGPLLRAAGLDPDALRRAPPSTAPLPFADTRRAFEGRDPQEPERSVRVEAAAFGGVPVHFRFFDAGRSPPPQAAPAGAGTLWSSASSVLALLWTGLALAGGIFLCLRHLRRRTADLRGATRLALLVVAGRFLVWVVGGHHTPSAGQLDVLEAQLERGLHDGLRVWIFYVALEPFARRRWAEQVASWVRLLHGRWRDRLLGRDLLVGSLTGLVLSICGQLYAVLPGWLGLAPPRIDRVAALAALFDEHGLARQVQAVLGLRETLAMSLYALLHALMLAFIATVGVVLLRIVLKRALLSRAVAVASMSVMLYPSAGHPLADALVVVLLSTLWITVLIRFGFLAGVTAVVVDWWVNTHPLTLDFEDWFATGAMVPVVLVIVLLLWGHRAALGKRPVLPDPALGDS